MPKSFRRRSYNALPALAVRGPALRASLQIITAGWMVGVFWAVFIYGSGWEILASMVGFDDFSFGLLQAAPHTATVFLLVASILIERTGLTKYQFVFFGLIHRLLWIAVAGVPLVVHVPSSLAVWVTLAIVFASWCAEALSRPAWLTWMGVLIPPRIRGRYWGRRMQFTTGMQIIAGLGINYIISRMQPAAGTASAIEHPHLLHGLMLLLAVTSICGVVDILLFLRVHEVIAATEPRAASQSGRRSPLVMLHWSLIQPFRDREFSRFIRCDMLMSFAMGAVGIYSLRNMRINLEMDAFRIGLLCFLVGPMAGIVSARFVGRMIDKWGPRPVMTYAAFGTTLGILPFLFMWKNMPGLMPLCVLTFIAGGAMWGSFLIGQSTVQLRFGDRPGASRYVSAYNFYLGVGGMTGALLAGGLTGWLEPHQLTLGPLVWRNWHAAFALSLAARTAGAMILRGKDAPAKV